MQYLNIISVHKNLVTHLFYTDQTDNVNCSLIKIIAFHRVFNCHKRDIGLSIIHNTIQLLLALSVGIISPNWQMVQAIILQYGNVIIPNVKRTRVYMYHDRYIHIYVTGNQYNQVICILPEIFR